MNTSLLARLSGKLIRFPTEFTARSNRLLTKRNLAIFVKQRLPYALPTNLNQKFSRELDYKVFTNIDFAARGYAHLDKLARSNNGNWWQEKWGFHKNVKLFISLLELV
jgi:hypothetical protein